MATVEILTIPIGSQLTSTIGANEPEDKNDFRVLLLFSENVTGLTESDVALSEGARLVLLTGENAVWVATIRPPETSGIVRMTVAANAVAQGNPQTSKDIRVTTFFADADAELPTLLFNHNLSHSWGNEGGNGLGITVTPHRILISSSGRTSSQNTISYIDFFTHQGTHRSGETITIHDENRFRLAKIDDINGDLLYQHRDGQSSNYGRLSLQVPEVDRKSGSTPTIAHSRLGVTFVSVDGVTFQPYDFSLEALTHEIDFFARISGGWDQSAAHQNDLLYLYTNYPYDNTFRGSTCVLSEITEADEIEILANLNIARVPGSNSVRDIAIFGETLYLLDSGGVYTVDIRKYRPMAKNTKSTIYPIFAEAGDTIDLNQFSPDAERIVFDVGYEKPPFLTINSGNKLSVGSDAQTCFVKLKAISRIDATETDSFGFYLIVRRAEPPVWRNVSELTMRAGSRYDLFELVPDAESISFRSGRAPLAESRLSNGMFKIGRVGGVAAFTARKGSRSSHIEINIDVLQDLDAEVYSDVLRYRVEIAGRDVSSDLEERPSVSETLDPVVLNEYRVNEAVITLRNEDGKYNSDIAGNFWETHGLNAGGFQHGVKIYRARVNGVESLLFTGVINESVESLKDVTFKLNCTDISSRLRNALAENFGTLEKWDALRKQSDEENYEGVYVPERSLLPMQVGTGEARSDRTHLDISRLELPSEGPIAENTGYMTATEFRTSGGFVAENPLLRFKAEHQSADVRFLINQLSINKEVYNTEIDLPGVKVADPFLLNRGSVAFSVEPTRITRIPVDWVHDATDDRILVLLSNPEGHIADLLVQYDINSDSYRVLHTFDKGVAVHRIERRKATNSYILTSTKILQDRSARRLPRHTDATGYAHDSLADGSEIKIYDYSTSTGTLTEHVAEDDSFPPQLGIHYHVGFENGVYIDAFEGIRPDSRGTLKWHSGNLYYRYAKDGEFGVASVDASGTATKMIGEKRLIDNNHLNFAFDVTQAGDVYMTCQCSIALASVTVVASTSIPGTITIADDLRSYAAPLLLEINFVSVRVRTNASITVKGTDVKGEPITEKISVGTDGTKTLSLDPYFLTVTSVTYFNLFEGSFSITTVGTSFPGFVIKRRTRGGTESTPLMDTRTLGTLTDLDGAGGVHLGVHECVYHANYLYILAQIGRVEVDGSKVSRSRQKAAGMVLYRCDVTAPSPRLTVLDKWDFVHQAGCNLTLHEGGVHYVEHPSASTAFKPINPDLDGYWTDDERTETMGYNVIPEALGTLKKVKSSGEVEHLGNVWHTDRPYNVFPTRMLSIDGDLHLSAGYGNLDELLRFNSLASGADNLVHIVYGRTLQYVLARFQPNGSIYAALAGLAKSVNATLSFEKNVIMISDRRAYRGLMDGATGTGTGDLRFSDANKVFPSRGYLLIGKEILKFSGITGGAFTGIERGVLGSRIENHADDSKVLYLDNIIQTEKLGSPYKAITLVSDTNRIYNIIRDSGGIAEVRDEDSIVRYGERPYTLDLGLTRHEKTWIEEIFKSYLEELKDLQQIVNIQVIPDDSLRLGQIVPFFYKDLIRAMRIVSVRYERRTTHIKGRTL